MSGTTRTSADLDPRRRRTLFRAWHRGIREMDLIMGRFADAEIGALSEEELTQVRGADRGARPRPVSVGSPARTRRRRTTTPPSIAGSRRFIATTRRFITEHRR
jgi:hypothetical protein